LTILLLAGGAAQSQDAKEDPEFKTAMTQAVTAAQREDLPSAVPLFEKALRRARELDAPASEATTLYNIGLVYYQMKEYPRAIQTLDQALEVIHRRKLSGAGGNTLFCLGLVHEAMGDLERAQSFLQQAVPLLGPSQQGAILGKLAQFAQRSGNLPAALAFLRRGIETYHAVQDLGNEANLLAHRRVIELGQGRNEEALQTSDQILALLEAVKDPQNLSYNYYEHLAMAHSGSALALLNLGRPMDALAAYEKARSILHIHQLKPQEALVLETIGGFHYGRGDFVRAIGYYGDAAQLYHSLTNAKGEAQVLHLMAKSDMNLGENRPVVIRNLRTACKVASSAGDLELQARLLETLGSALRRRSGETAGPALLAEAISTYEEAGRLWERWFLAGNQAGLRKDTYVVFKANLEFALSVAHVQGHKKQAVIPCLVEVERLAALPGLEVSTHLFAVRIAAHLAGVLSHREKAKTLLDSALALAEAADDDDARAAVLTEHGAVLETMGDTRTALANYLRAAGLWEHLRGRAGATDLQAGVSEHAADAYQRAMLLLVRLGRAQEAFELSERARARAFLDQLGGEHVPAPPSTAPLAGEEEALRRNLMRLDAALRQLAPGSMEAVKARQ
jgi:tetratricopeptide (TPR) repeat protein